MRPDDAVPVLLVAVLVSSALVGFAIHTPRLAPETTPVPAPDGEGRPGPSAAAAPDNRSQGASGHANGSDDTRANETDSREQSNSTSSKNETADDSDTENWPNMPPYPDPLRPGAAILLRPTPENATWDSLTGENASCTLGFLFEGKPVNATGQASSLYGTTAGHCVDAGGRLVVKGTGSGFAVVGKVVAHDYDHDYDEDNVTDWALIEFHPEVEPHVNATVRHWTGPTRPIQNESIQREDVVCWYAAKRAVYPEERCGRHVEFYRANYHGAVQDFLVFRGQSAGGDSGAPVIHHPTGQAIGLVKSAVPQPVYHRTSGMTVCAIENVALNAGYNVTLATADYDPPDEEPTIPHVTRIDETIDDSEAPGDCGPMRRS